MQLKRLFRKDESEAAARALYLCVVAQARRPDFYTRIGVPDTLDGRFDMILMHAFLLLRRLKGERARAARLGQDLYDVMFADMDRNLREIGVGDLGVGKHVKRMASAFGGRTKAYEAGLAGSDEELAAALRRNLYGTVTPSEEHLAGMVAYLRREADKLARQPLDDLLAGRVSFGPPPA